MSKLVKLKLASKKSLSCFLPSRMASSGTSALFPSTEPEAPDDGRKLNGIKAVNHGPKPNGNPNEQKLPETKTHAVVAPQPSENPVREIVSYGVKSKEELPKAEEPEEILELKTPGFIRVFGCDSCDDSDSEIRQNAHNSSSEESEDYGSTAHHQPPHLIPVVHLRVPMKSEDDVRKVVAALQIKGVLEVACDIENQIVKVSGNADPDRLLKKVKKVKRKAKLISYSNPSEMPMPPPASSFHSDIPLPTPPPPAYAFHQPAYEERFRPPPQPHVFNRDSHGPFGAPPPHVRPNLGPAAHPRHYDNEAFYHHQRPTPNVRPPPPAPFYRDHGSFATPDYIPSNLRPPSSPPHYSSSSSFYHERSPPSLRRSTSPPRRRSYLHTPHFRPPPPMHYPGGPPPSRSPWRPGAPYCMDDFQQVPDRMMHMYH